MSEQVFDTDRQQPSGTELMGAVVEAGASVEESRLSRLQAVAALDSARGFEYDGFTSTTSFLIARCGLGAGEANREVFLARSLEHMAYAAKLAHKGDLTIAQLEVLAHGRSRHPDPYAADEPTLAESAAGLSLGDTRRLVTYWSQAHDQGQAEEAPPSQVHLSKTWGGRGRLDGDLDPEHRALVSEALDTLMSELVRTTPKDELPPSSFLRAEALAELARRHLDSSTVPTDHGNRPHLTAIVDLGTLMGTGGGEPVCEFIDGTIISPATARRIACDANVCRLLMGPSGEILDLGRTRRTVSPAQWRALRVRDRHCVFPSCRRSASWCDAHHIVPWFPDGLTDLENLVLLCRHHHTMVHEGGWSLTGDAGALTCKRPDGSVLAHAPP